ncbi:GNAT family N-acetyltransferase [Streptomyces sp. NBC_01433]|uniref:GNAT family N-acetyltransferase n=1 Tax=Streptomyces sp. NBC_01433 TaxID=2903864 RepID=UPI00225AFF61|nr:GNAT family N-acetyltransferase [Streptomyces sp. NBC_01433]MCX4680612.1 GNAT family N-acetyltransferase [Streptomyces sp. NBC_01433]
MNPHDELTVSTATLEDWYRVAEWADGEGWNVGNGDVACFHPTDPAGFFIGRLDGRPVAAVSIVNYSDRYAVLGHYLTDPEFRGRGHGLATWNAAFPHAGNRTVGLDAMPAQQANYETHGFKAVHDTVHYAGRPARPAGLVPGTVRVTPEHTEALAAYDRGCFPADRSGFVARWLTSPGRTARARLRDGAVAGYGVIRPAGRGHRIGPLFADTPQDAAALFDSLVSHLGPDEEVSLDIPGTHTASADLLASRGLEARFHTVRMYTGPVPETAEERVFATTTLELG